MINPNRAIYLTVKLADLYARAADRPDDYVDTVLAYAVQRDDTHVLLTRTAYDALRRNYAALATPDDSPATGYDGSALWARMHTATAPDQAFVDGITAEIPCGSCRAEWMAMLGRTPADFTSLDAFRQWAVDRHNEVNARIGKPLVTYAAAAARWNW
jgi:hypothetical protein